MPSCGTTWHDWRAVPVVSPAAFKPCDVLFSYLSLSGIAANSTISAFLTIPLISFSSYDHLFHHSPSISQYGFLLAADTNDSSLGGRWSYCLTQDWQPGLHRVQMLVSPPQGSPQTFEWKFEVGEDPLTSPSPAPRL